MLEHFEVLIFVFKAFFVASNNLECMLYNQTAAGTADG